MMRLSSRCYAVFVLINLVSCTLAPYCKADVVTQWNFNSTVPDASTATGVLTPAIGAGTLSLIGGVTNTFSSGDANGGSSDPSTGDDSGLQTTGYAAPSSGNKTTGIQFNVSTLGWQNVVLNYDLRHSNTSSRFEQLQYSLDGTNFVDAQLFDGNAGDTWFNNRTADLSGIAGVSNNANFSFRVVAAFDPAGTNYLASNLPATYAATGTWRFDMVTVNATAVPEPTSLAFVALTLAPLAWRLRSARNAKRRR